MAYVTELTCTPALVQEAREVAADYVPVSWPHDLHWPVAVPYRKPLVHTGAIASADVWTQSPARLDLLHRRHGALCEDMEAAAVAQVCALHSVPFLTIKDISNNEFHTVTQGDRILIPCIDVDRRLEGELITGPWAVDQCSTLLLLLEM